MSKEKEENKREEKDTSEEQNSQSENSTLLTDEEMYAYEALIAEQGY